MLSKQNGFLFRLKICIFPQSLTKLIILKNQGWNNSKSLFWLEHSLRFFWASDFTKPHPSRFVFIHSDEGIFPNRIKTSFSHHTIVNVWYHQWLLYLPKFEVALYFCYSVGLQSILYNFQICFGNAHFENGLLPFYFYMWEWYWFNQKINLLYLKEVVLWIYRVALRISVLRIFLRILYRSAFQVTKEHLRTKAKDYINCLDTEGPCQLEWRVMEVWSVDVSGGWSRHGKKLHFDLMSHANQGNDFSQMVISGMTCKRKRVWQTAVPES